MKTLIPLIVRELSQERAAALCTVIAQRGSAPRGAGACLLALADGTFAGTVGGGLLEHQAQQEAQTLLAAPGSYLREYALTQDDIQSLGMVCGGNVALLYQALPPEQLPFWRQMENRLLDGEALWLLRRLERGTVTGLDCFGQHGGCALLESDALNPYRCRKPLWEAADEKSSATKTPLADAPLSYFAEPVQSDSHAYLFGGGHVAQALAPLLAQLDFAPVVYDDRAEFANSALFPDAAGVVCAPFSEAGKRLSITARDEIVIMTRGHANDQAILTQALRTDAYYIGLIGSRSKIAHTKSLLLAEGFSETDFARIHTPIGLPILAETPMEIAVSVAAEMILHRAQSAQ